MDKIEELFKAPYWIIDIFPKQVSKDSPGQFFKIEEYMLRDHIGAIKQKHINLILKLNCYMDVELEGEKNPNPEKITEIMKKQNIYIMVGDAMILSEPDDTYMTFFNPDDEMISMIKMLSAAEGMFVWKPM